MVEISFGIGDKIRLIVLKQKGIRTPDGQENIIEKTKARHILKVEQIVLNSSSCEFLLETCEVHDGWEFEDRYRLIIDKLDNLRKVRR